MASNTPAPLDLGGKVAIVTVASQGTGPAIALELAQHGANVVIFYSSPTSDKAVNKLIHQVFELKNGSRAIGVCADLCDPRSMEQIIKVSISDFGSGIDILVNSADTSLTKDLANITQSDFAHAYDLNARAVVFSTQAVLPHLRAPGREINVSSVGAGVGIKDFTLYCSSKAALEGLTRFWAMELSGNGHTVNCVNPGPEGTRLREGIPKEIVERHMEDTPLENRIGKLDDITAVVAWLASEGSRWVTGQCISASGGWAIY